MSGKIYYVYIVASKMYGTLYIGVTSELIRRIWGHKQGLVDGFTKRYRVDRLVYFEETSDIESAIRREKQLKKWERLWKLRLIEKRNPDWINLFEGIKK